MLVDYYAALGVLPTAEDIVIKAAYRALAQNYHPDRYSGSADYAHQRMAEINEAYSVLSDPILRAAYDNRRENADKSSFADDTSGVDESVDLENALKSDWNVACTYYPDLVEIFEGLKKTAIRLAVTFETVMLSSKSFEGRFDIAAKLEQMFLEKYFGTSPLIIAFAKQLIKDSNKPALQELNNAVRVLGSDVNPDVIIDAIAKKFCAVKIKSPASFSETQIRFAQNYWHEFRRAVLDGKPEIVRKMLWSDPALLVISNSDKNTALHLSVIERRYEIFNLLLEAGADPRLENAAGTTVVAMCGATGLEKYKQRLMLMGYYR